MTTEQRTVVSMQFDEDFVIDSWLSFSLRDSFTDPLSEFQFEVAPPREQVPRYNDRLVKGVLVGVLVNDAPQASMLISSVTRRVDRARGVVYSVSCKSVLQTPYEGSVNPRLALSTTADVPVTTAVLQALSPYGFSTITGDAAASANAVSGKPINGRRAALVVEALKHQDCQAQEGETAYAFCSRIFTRLGVALRVTHTGQLLLSAPDYDQDPIYSLSHSFSQSHPADADVMLTHEDTSTNDGQFSEVRVRGTRSERENVSAVAEPDASVSAADVLPARSRYSSSVASYKPRVIKDKNARDVDRARNVCKLALSLPAVNAYSLSCEVAGIMSRTGRVWAVDTIAHVYSEALAIDEEMWILERELAMDRGGGQRTRLKLLPKGALVLGDLPS